METDMLVIIEGIVLCFILLITCVIGIANGPVGMVCMYEQDVQDRAVELGLTTKQKIKKSLILSGIALFLPLFTYVPFAAYVINGAVGFWSGFWQMSAMMWIMGIFDRIFVDWYWVGHTKAWLIPETEDLMPYIPKKMMIVKWTFTIIGMPMIAAMLAGVVELIGKF